MNVYDGASSRDLFNGKDTFFVATLEYVFIWLKTHFESVNQRYLHLSRSEFDAGLERGLIYNSAS